jgi:hypothetical protein
MNEKLRTSWRSYREKRRQYQIERALYKAGGHGDARHGGFGKEPDQLSDNPPPASRGEPW